MKPYRSYSVMLTTALCALGFFLTSTMAKDLIPLNPTDGFAGGATTADVVGILVCKGTVLKNKQPAKNGDEVRNGDIIQTPENRTAIVSLSRGGEVYIHKMTRVRIYDAAGEPMEFLVVFGGIDLRGLDNRDPSEWPAGWAGDASAAIDGETGGAPLPYLAAFGFGNFSFPAIGGGSPTSNQVISQVLPNGTIVFLNSLGQVIGLGGSPASLIPPGQQDNAGAGGNPPGAPGAGVPPGNPPGNQQ